MSEQQPHKDPPIYKHLSPKTQAFLRASAPQRFESARLHGDTMSNEQTYVLNSIKLSIKYKWAVKLMIRSFIAIKPDGVQVRVYLTRSSREGDVNG
jgi:hypothetical protein